VIPAGSFILQAVVAGILATVVLDLWQRLLQAVAGVPAANWGLIGRWFAYIPRGRLIHRPIAETAAVPGEAAIGWIMHYLIGVAYGFAYLGLMVFILERPATLLNGLVFGAASVVIPWFIMQPGLGIGVMGRLAPKPWMPPLVALVNHVVYGAALFGGVWIAAQV